MPTQSPPLRPPLPYRSTTLAILAAGAIALQSTTSEAREPTAAERPNIVLIMADENN
jgi:hypothetical protein